MNDTPPDNAAITNHALTLDDDPMMMRDEPPAVGPVNHARRLNTTIAEAEAEAKLVQGRLWLISFTDLFSILLCFFMMMFAMKDPDIEKVGRMGGRKTYDINEGAGKTNLAGQSTSTGTFKGAGINQIQYGEALNLDYLQGVLRNNLKQAGIDGDIRLLPGRDHLKLLIDPDRLFAGGTLSMQGIAILRALAGRLSLLPNAATLMVTPEAGSGWDVSYTQADAVASTLRDAGYSKPMIVLGVSGGVRPVVEIRLSPDDGLAK